MALDAVPLMRTGTRGSPSWPNASAGRPDTFLQTAQPRETSHLRTGRAIREPRRALLQQAQALQGHRHPIREARRQLPGSRQTRSCTDLDAFGETLASAPSVVLPPVTMRREAIARR